MSFDWALGGPANMLQCYFFLQLMAQVTGHTAGQVTHHVVNAHIYENQLELAKEQLKRTPHRTDTQFWVNPNIRTLEDIDKMTKHDVKLIGYFSDYDPIKYPFTV